MNLQEYVLAHTDRGECRCGSCIDRGDRPDPGGHTIDMVFFIASLRGQPDAEELRRLILEHRGEFCEVNLFDGAEHSYMELGGWIGDQGLALMFMALGSLLGLFRLMTPRTVLGTQFPDSLLMRMAESGLVTIQAVPAATPESPAE